LGPSALLRSHALENLCPAAHPLLSLGGQLGKALHVLQRPPPLLRRKFIERAQAPVEPLLRPGRQSPEELVAF
jgi:hypothetical protein